MHLPTANGQLFIFIFMENLLPTLTPLEVWGGVECSVVRVGDEWTDQLRRNGHQDRLDDLDRFFELGLRTLRFPVIWERTAPEHSGQYDWQWSDERLHKLWQLGVRPLVGLLHHGSGPRYAPFHEPHFPDEFARYARAVAERYPWVSDYTPINEPLTTARFSGLYGHWYPHQRDERACYVILLNEVKATVLAMRAIREVRPDARLIQTEDFGYTHATPAVGYQADFENERRWLTWDLLCGRVVPGHRMFAHLRWLGFSEKEILFFAENPCPPDLIGVNHYVTSERFLDDRIEKYPSHLVGGNDRHAYADTEAVRAEGLRMKGIGNLLAEVWARYQLPVAVTEAHLGCTREEQMRWFWEVWQAVCQQRQRGADIRAVTAWALLGSFDWDSLLTQNRGHYEPGVFDVRTPDGRLRATALTRLIHRLTHPHPRAEEPVLASRGWWQPKPEHRPLGLGTEAKPKPPVSLTITVLKPSSARPLLITGATGTLGRAFARLAAERGLEYRLLDRRQLDIADPQAVRQVLLALQPWAVVNTAGFVRVAEAEQEKDCCYRENRTGPAVLAEACGRHEVKLLTFSSDLVFDGKKGKAYVESDEVAPQGVYGASKAAAERIVLNISPEALVVRTSAFFGPWDEHNFATIAARKFFSEHYFDAAAHVRVSPTYVPDLVHASLDLLIDGASGRWHLANAGGVSWADFARQVAIGAGLDPRRVEAWYEVQCDDCAHLPPLGTELTSEKATLMPSFESALSRFLREKSWQRNPVVA
jgi:dTDP-4-dehydrorhamnose reductase